MSEDLAARPVETTLVTDQASVPKKVRMIVFWTIFSVLLTGASLYTRAQNLCCVLGFLAGALVLVAVWPAMDAEDRARTNRQSIIWWSGFFGCLGLGLAVAAIWYAF